MKAKHCHTFTDGDIPVSLHQTPTRFVVTYGAEMWTELYYPDAAARYGGAVMHSLRCAGKLDSTDEEG